MHQHFGIPARPSAPGGRGDLGIAGRRQRIRARRLEQAVIAQVRGDDARQLDPERGRARLVGGRRHVAVGREGGNGDAEIVEPAFVADRDVEAFALVNGLDHPTFGRRFTQILILGAERRGDERCGGQQRGENTRNHWASLQSRLAVMVFQAS